MDKNSFLPFDLSKASVDEKKDYFTSRTINHPKLNNTLLEVYEKVNEAPAGKVFLVFGPTGVGKSTLCKKIKNDIMLRHINNNQINKGIIPVASLELPSPDNGKFNWKDFYKRLLKEVNEPLIDDKIPIKSAVNKKNIPNYLPGTSPELREALENAIRNRKTKLILLDEAQHLLKVAGGKGIEDQLDTIKSLANLSESVFVMFGTYELMNFFDLNGQLGRRTKEIHFPRYDIREERDKQEFKSVINTFQKQLPFFIEADLLNHWEFLYERSIGCIGILKEWLDECVKVSLNKDQTTITFEVLNKHAPSPSKSLKIAEETLQGEEKAGQYEEALYSLKERLGIGSINRKIKSKKNKEEKLPNKNREVGKRNPSRDEIGIKENGA